MLKKILAIIAIASFSFTAVAQNIEGLNARLDGIAGSGPIDDIAWTIDKPSALYMFPNQLQGSVVLLPLPGIGESYGAIIGVVRISDLFYAGLTLNDRPKMPAADNGGFYLEGAKFLNDLISEADISIKGFPNLPHLNLCWKFNDKVKLGVGGYTEGIRHSKKEIKFFRINPVSGTDSTIEYNSDTNKKRILNNGGYLEARFTMGTFTLNPYVAVGLPRIGGSDKVNTLTKAKEQLASNPSSSPIADPLADIENTYKSSKGLYLKAGTNLWVAPEKLLAIGGLFYTQREWQFEKSVRLSAQMLNGDGSMLTNLQNDTTYIDTTSTHQVIKNYDWWLAIQPTYADGFYFAPEYDGGIIIATGDEFSTTNKNWKDILIYINFRLGIEKVIKNVRVFDEIALRCGIVGYWWKEIRKLKNTDATTSSVTDYMPWKPYPWGAADKYRQAKITAGLGWKVGRGTFDVSVDLMKFKGIGVLSGPPAAMASLTTDFGPSK